MSTLTIRLPDGTAERLESLARSRGPSVNKLIEELSARALAAYDTETRFRALAAQGDPKGALRARRGWISRRRKKKSPPKRALPSRSALSPQAATPLAVRAYSSIWSKFMYL